MTISSDLVAVNRAAEPGPVVVSIPHAGRFYPQEILDAARVSQDVLERLEDRWSDLIAADVVAAGGTTVQALAARAVADCNRAEDQMAAAEVDHSLRRRMAGVGDKERAGLGVIPTRLGREGALWKRPLDADSLEWRLNAVHRPYHHKLAQELAAAKARHGFAILIDLHSMPSIGIGRIGYGQELIVGDLFRSSGMPSLTQAAIQMGLDMGLRVGLNRPYAGGDILARHGSPDHHIYAVQLEWDRSLYLDGDQMPDDKTLKWLQNGMADLVSAVGGDSFRGRRDQQAAE